MNASEKKFQAAAAIKAADLAHRATMRKNILSYEQSHARGKERFADWQLAREQAKAIKAEALEHLSEYLEQFEAKVKQRGGHVFWAENADQAVRYVADLARRHKVKTVVKSKSMVTEEIHLADALEEVGAKVWETDLGEFIVQLRKEPPYHIVTPAMHLTRKEIADLFKEKVDPEIDFDDPVKLVAVARRALREAFFSAEMGISGANFLVADAGMVALSTNEGNGRLTTSLPKIHVAVTGIEKVIPRLTDLALLWPVLATAGTGQPVTTYGTLVGGPRAEGEADGPEEFHVVLLDNGRTRILEEEHQRNVLSCLRCGACLNVCPVYKAVGGHTYGSIYPGPIGSVLMPLLAGEEQYGHLPFASSLCNACADICPVKIDLPRHLLEHRHVQADRPARAAERASFRMFGWMMASASRYRLLAGFARKMGNALQAMGLDFFLGPWKKYRAPMPIPKESFRDLWKKGGGDVH